MDTNEEKNQETIAWFSQATQK